MGKIQRRIDFQQTSESEFFMLVNFRLNTKRNDTYIERTEKSQEKKGLLIPSVSKLRVVSTINPCKWNSLQIWVFHLRFVPRDCVRIDTATSGYSIAESSKQDFCPITNNNNNNTAADVRNGISWPSVSPARVCVLMLYSWIEKTAHVWIVCTVCVCHLKISVSVFNLIVLR